MESDEGTGAETPAEDKEKSDREEGGPTAPLEPTEETSDGEGRGTRPSPFDPHTD